MRRASSVMRSAVIAAVIAIAGVLALGGCGAASTASDGSSLQFDELGRTLNKFADASSDPTEAIAIASDAELADSWAAAASSELPSLDGRVGVLVNGGPKYRNVEVTALRDSGGTWEAALSVQRTAECSSVDVVATEVIALAVDVAQIPDGVEVVVVERGGCDS